MRVLLADDQTLFRKTLASFLASNSNIKVVGEAESGFQAIEKAQQLRPDLILMDVNMPGCNGLQATKRIKELLPEIKIVMLTISDEDEDLFEAIKSGACGYLLKNLNPEELLEHMEDVFEGKAALTPAVATKVLDEFVRLSTKNIERPSVFESLTSREKEILKMVTEGDSNKEIAHALSITEGTVKNHLHKVLEKLQLRNRAQAAVVALKEGLFKPEEYKKLNLKKFPSRDE